MCITNRPNLIIIKNNVSKPNVRCTMLPVRVTNNGFHLKRHFFGNEKPLGVTRMYQI